ncbi:MAG: hypothetical protein IPK81_18830 [Rhodospirillales bacterium]|nr:MAG: hypothetical protein IPK81_18830 [Rhodospirillales bacterium]
MIPRYSRPPMVAIWEPPNRFRIWFEVEAHACDAMAELGVMPKSAAAAIWKGGREAMAAMAADPAAHVGRIDEIERVTKHDVIAFTTWLAEFVGPDSRFVHQGLTSSDVLDTTLAVQMTQAADLLLEDLDKVLAALRKRAMEHRNTPTIGRSHAIHAEPTTFGVKLAGNPVLTENLTGLARLVRGYVTPALENVALWHERDISHSSVERMIGPDATITLDFALNRLAGVVENLVVYADRMKANLDSLGGLVFSQRVMLALTQKGMSREEAYAAVQRNAMEGWKGNAAFMALCRADPEIRKLLADDEIVAMFDMGYHTRHVDMIFARVFGT